MEESATSLEQEVSGLGMFVGEYTHSLDPKRRLTIPAVWRSQVGKPRSVYVVPDLHSPCLNVFPAGEMLHRLAALRKHSLADRKAQQFAAVLGRSSDVLSWDTQGRIRIHDKLLAFAGLTDQVILVGALDRFQLWSPERSEGIGELDQASLREAAQYVGF